MNILTILATIMSILLPIFYSCHVFRMFRKKSSEGQSLVALSYEALASAVILVYGIAKTEQVLIFSNIAWLIVLPTAIYLALKYRRKNGTHNNTSFTPRKTRSGL
jgi:uncharacterized protein with PQ loop repeat